MKIKLIAWRRRPRGRHEPRRLVTLLALAGALVLGAACEKDNDVVIQEQLRESQERCARGCEVAPPGCTIKGNISSEGAKFYHVVGTQNYEDIRIEPVKGERWFCTEDEAIGNGFVRKDY